MKIKAYKVNSWFKFVLDSYESRAEEYVIIVFILFKWALRFEFWPKRNRNIIPHCEIRIPPGLNIIDGDGNVKKYKTKMFERHK